VSADVDYPGGGAYLDQDEPSAEVTVEDAGEVYVTVEGDESDFASFPYSWQLTASNSPGEDDWSDNDHRPVEFGTYTGDVNTDDDTDLLKFQVERGDVVSLSLSSDTPDSVSADVDYPGGSAYLDQDEPSAEVTVEDAGEVYVTVGGDESDVASFPYSWTITAVPPGTDPQQPPSASLTASPSSPTVDETVTLDASGSTDDGTIVSYEWDFDDDGTVERTTDTPQTTTSYTTAGTYVASVTVVDDDEAEATATTTVEVERSPDPAENDRFEPNDGRTNAERISPGTYDDLQIVDGESDYFAVDLDANEEITAETVFDHSTGDLDLALRDPSGNAIQTSVSTTDDETVSAVADEAGTYYIEVYGYIEASAPYSLSVSTTDTDGGDGDDGDGTPEDRFEPNDQLSTAASPGPGTYEGLRITEDDIDVFAVEIEASQTLTASAQFDHSVGNLELAIGNSSGGLVDASTSTTDDESVSVTPDEPGTYYVVVGSAEGEETAPYTLSLSTDGGSTGEGDDRFEPNDRPSSATPIDAGTYRNLVVGGSDEDVFEIELDRGQGIEVTTSAEGVESYLYSPSGEFISTSAIQAGGIDRERVSASGTYRIAVISEEETTSEYSLTVETTDGNRAPTADAGSDRSVVAGASVELDATDSTDPDGDPLTYEWTQTEGPTVPIAASGSSTPTVNAPRVTSETSMTFEVTVTDESGTTDTDTVTITVRPSDTSDPSDPSDEGILVEIAPADATVAPGGTRTFEVRVPEIEGGFDTGDFDITLSDPSVATFTSATIAGDPQVAAVDTSADSVEFAFVGTDTSVTGNATVASVTVRATEEGSTALQFEPARDTFIDESDTVYQVGEIRNASLNAGSAPAVTDRPATDPDGDGLYEDVNGDGTFNIVDVSVFLESFDGATVRSNADSFDFAGDGRVDIVDVSVLLTDL
jgi:PKD repeat protein